MAMAEFSSGEPAAWIVCSQPPPPTGCGLMEDKATLLHTAKSLFNAGYGTAIGAGINAGQAVLHAGPLARPSARKVMLLLSDGNNNFPPDPVSAAAAARAAGTEIYIVAVGHKRNESALAAMASRPVSQHLFQSSDFADLLTALQNATSAVCDRYVCVDDAVCMPAPAGHSGVPWSSCNATCHPALAEEEVETAGPYES